MKKLNNKGMTLLEIMISISLVSIVMIFTLNLLNDLRSEEYLGNDKTADLLNRSIISKKIQNDFITKGIKQVGQKDVMGATVTCQLPNDAFSGYTVNQCLAIYYKNSATNPYYIVTATKNVASETKEYFLYGLSNSFEAWELKSAEYIKDGMKIISPGPINDEFKEDFFIISIPTKITEEMGNTSMNFDLEFFYYYYIPDKTLIPYVKELRQ